MKITLLYLEGKYDVLCREVADSTIPEDNPVHQEVARLHSKLWALNLGKKGSASMIGTTATTTPTKSKSVQLPKLHLPTFNGDLMELAPFWAQFKTAVDSNSDLSPEHKLAYLRDAIKDPSVNSLMFSGAEREGLYAEVVAMLHQRYDKKRSIHAAYCQQLTSFSQVKNNKADLLQFLDKINHAVAGLKHTRQFELSPFLSSILTLCLPKILQTEGEVHSKESKDDPPLEEFLKFISFRADVLSAAPPPVVEGKPKSSEVKTESYPRKHRAATHANTARPSPNYRPASTEGFKYECMLCPGLKHPLFMCEVFNQMNVHKREEHVRTKTCVATV